MKILKDAGFTAKEIKEIIDGIKVTARGESKDCVVGGAKCYKEEYRTGILEHIVDLRNQGFFEGGFKYPEFGPASLQENGYCHANWLEANGFRPVANHVHTWINADLVTISATNANGGYVGLMGPYKETREMFMSLLERMSYVKDVSPYCNHLGGGLESVEAYAHVVKLVKEAA